ncbi:unnamed protein product [Ranitomeya imitator]|uniref:Uncharacterized protein n=1 Tax=Ranitomeya imitator TaxID=111125 RepID=A0ABN9KZN2_9NEOB|nr:unnamed protein product [Ranitomeya imitator]
MYPFPPRIQIPERAVRLAQDDILPPTEKLKSLLERLKDFHQKFMQEFFSMMDRTVIHETHGSSCSCTL